MQCNRWKFNFYTLQELLKCTHTGQGTAGWVAIRTEPWELPCITTWIQVSNVITLMWNGKHLGMNTRKMAPDAWNQPPALLVTVRPSQLTAAGLGTTGTNCSRWEGTQESNKRELRIVMFNEWENEHTGVVQPRKEQTEENVSLKYIGLFERGRESSLLGDTQGKK